MTDRLPVQTRRRPMFPAQGERNSAVNPFKAFARWITGKDAEKLEPLILQSLAAEGPAYGWLLMKRIENSQGDLLIGIGTLYLAIDRLKRRALIAESKPMISEVTGESRIAYDITMNGLSWLKAQDSLPVR